MISLSLIIDITYDFILNQLINKCILTVSIPLRISLKKNKSINFQMQRCVYPVKLLLTSLFLLVHSPFYITSFKRIFHCQKKKVSFLCVYVTKYV